MRVSGDSATICFLIAGIVIRAKVRALPRETKYEQEIAEKQQKAIKRLWIVIRWFMFLSVSLILIDLGGFLLNDTYTGRIVNEPLWLNDLIICLARTLAYVAWVVPVFYLFWPSIISSQRRALLTENINKRTIAGHTLPSGLVSGYISGDIDQHYSLYQKENTSRTPVIFSPSNYNPN